MARLITLLIGIVTLVAVAVVTLMVKIARKLQLKEKADAAFMWYKNTMKGLFAKVAALFRK